MGASIGANPFAAWKERRGFTSWEEVARRLGVSVSYMTKLGTDNATGLSPELAEQFERRSGGEIKFDVAMRWAAAMSRAARRKRQRAERQRR